MVTVEQAKEALDKLWGESRQYDKSVSWYILEEFINQQPEEKPKRIPHLLNNKP